MFRIISNFLEPFSYFIYAGLFISVVRSGKDLKKIVLLSYYLFASGVLFYACLLSHVGTWGDNNWLYNLFFLVTIIVLSFYFHQILLSGKKKTAVKIIISINLIQFVLYDIVRKHFHFTYNYNVVAFCFLSIIIYCFLFFHQLITNVSERSILHNFDFWLVAGYLFYFLGAFFVILFYSNTPVGHRRLIWGVQNIILLLSSLITLCGNLWMVSKRKIA